MTKDQLLAVAKDKYPIGTEVKCCYKKKKKTIRSHTHAFGNNSDIWLDGGAVNILIYDSSNYEWAEIIQPKQKELIGLLYTEEEVLRLVNQSYLNGIKDIGLDMQNEWFK